MLRTIEVPVRGRRVRTPSLRLGLALVALLGACSGPGTDRGSSPSKPSGRPSVLLVSLDTTRADHLGAYGYPSAATPNLDAWAAEGALFEEALTPVPITLPAHASMLTGLLPHRHGLRDNGLYRLSRESRTLAAVLREAGYGTAAVVGAAVLDRQYGLDLGFSSYDDAVGGSGGLAFAERTAGAVTDAALAAARSLRSPFFLFVHYFDPHAAYKPPPAFAERFRDQPYDGEIAYVDSELGRLRRGLSDQGLLQNTLVVIAGDHGESLGEHGEATHGVFLYQSTLHVPLILTAPGHWPGGKRVRGLASLVDIAPTVLDLVGLPVPDSLDGRSLIPRIKGGVAEGRPLPVESEFGFNSYGWAPLVGLTDGRVKWIGAPEAELYDLLADPREQTNLAEVRRDDVRRLERLRMEACTEDRRALPVADASERETADRLSRLASLGYTAGGAAPAAGLGSLPDPKRVISSLELVNDARRLIGEGRFDDAASKLERVRRDSPRNLSALTLLGVSHLLAGRPQRALEPLRRASEVGPANADVHFNLGLAAAGVGDAAAAEKAYRRCLLLAPRYQDAAVNLVSVLLQTDRPKEALAALADARRAGLEGGLLDFLEGKLAVGRGDTQAARAALGRALTGSLPPPVASEARELLRAAGGAVP